MGNGREFRVQSGEAVPDTRVRVRRSPVSSYKNGLGYGGTGNEARPDPDRWLDARIVERFLSASSRLVGQRFETPNSRGGCGKTSGNIRIFLV